MHFLILGAGPMAVEYAKVLNKMNHSFIVVGRGEDSAEKFFNQTAHKAIAGGHELFFKNQIADTFTHCIVAVGEKHLGRVTRDVIDFGIKNILVEKPGGFDENDIREVKKHSEKMCCNVYVGYNRRFYASTLKAQDILAEDGGLTSFSFEFTERNHIIETIEKEEGVKQEWFLANSTHVIDLAFYLSGKPKSLVSFSAGKLTWHPKAVYSGAGISEKGALFSYQANWRSPGGWGIELHSKNYRLVLRPMESLQIQKIGTDLGFVQLDDSLDKMFKPGLYRQVKAFIEKNPALPTIQEQCSILPWYEKMKKSTAQEEMAFL